MGKFKLFRPIRLQVRCFFRCCVSKILIDSVVLIFLESEAHRITLLYDNSGIVYHLEFSEESKNSSHEIIDSHLQNIALFSHSRFALSDDLRTLRVRVTGETIFSNEMKELSLNLTNEVSKLVAKHKRVIWGDNHRILKVSSMERQYFIPNNREVK